MIIGLIGAGVGAGLGWAIRQARGLPVFDRYRAAPRARPSRDALDIGVGAAAAALFAYLVASGRGTGTTILLMLIGAYLLLIAALDLRYHVVPNALVYPAAALLFLGRLLVFGPADAVIALCAGAGGFAFFLVVAAISPGGLGGGDIKLAAVVGLLVSFPGVIWATVVAILAGGIVAVLAVSLGRRDAIPYAPYLCAGAMVVLLWDPLPWLTALVASAAR